MDNQAAWDFKKVGVLVDKMKALGVKMSLGVQRLERVPYKGLGALLDDLGEDALVMRELGYELYKRVERLKK